jgi:hypothetical protein
MKPIVTVAVALLFLVSVVPSTLNQSDKADNYWRAAGKKTVSTETESREQFAL